MLGMMLKILLLLVASLSFAGFLLIASALSDNLFSRLFGLRTSLLTRGLFGDGDPPPLRYALALFCASSAALWLASAV